MIHTQFENIFYLAAGKLDKQSTIQDQVRYLPVIAVQDCYDCRPSTVNQHNMYSIKIRQHIMIAHSLKSPAFGPAQQMHGATYVVDAQFNAKKLDKNNIVIDIDKAMTVLKKVLAPLNYQNLDELPQFKGILTTTEFLAHYIHQQIAKEVKSYFKGDLKITLGESHVAWASYKGKV